MQGCPPAEPAEPAACRLHPSQTHHLTACASLMQGFLQYAPKSAVNRLLKGAVQGAAEYSSPRPTPKGRGPAGGRVGARIVANCSSRTFRPQP